MAADATPPLVFAKDEGGHCCYYRCSRRKAVVVPFIPACGDDPPRFMLVRDRATGEWGFVSGGCRSNEDFEEGGARELEEETRGAVRRHALHRPMSFDLHTRSAVPHRQRRDGAAAEARVIHTHSRVFVFALHECEHAIARDFHARPPRTRAEAETDDICVATLEQMDAMNMWAEARERIVRNPKLLRLVDMIDGRKLAVFRPRVPPPRDARSAAAAHEATTTAAPSDAQPLAASSM